jgi:hypothetical protein
MTTVGTKLIKELRLSSLHGEKGKDTIAKNKKMNKSNVSRSKTINGLLLLKEDNT